MSRRRPAVHQVLATLGYGDAIGNEVLAIQRVLRGVGYQSDIFVETADPRLEPLTRDYRDLVDATSIDNLLLHHYSIGSKASRTAFAMPDRMVLIYHNITPPEFFAGRQIMLARQCFQGRRELGAYANRCELALADSEFNRQDLEHLGFPRTAVLPVVPDFSHLDRRPERFVTRGFDDEWTNILFVGRVIANKKIEDLIRFFHAYQTRFNFRSRLLIVGWFNQFDPYVIALSQLIRDLDVRDVYLTGHISNEELVAYYEVADLFLCASEHEGFCVPLVEAFYKQIPVLAFAASAVPSTMDGAGVLFTDKDPYAVAALMDAILSGAALQDAIVEGQTVAVRRRLAIDFPGTLLGFVDAVLKSPRAAEPHVAYDFWDQFDAAERLEELRLYRPSIYLALPDWQPESDRQDT